MSNSRFFTGVIIRCVSGRGLPMFVLLAVEAVVVVVVVVVLFLVDVVFAGVVAVVAAGGDGEMVRW